MKKHVISLPWEQRGAAKLLGLTWDENLREFIYLGAKVPDILHPYTSEDHSWERWIEDEANGRVAPTQIANYRMKPHEHQMIAARKIAMSAKSGYKGFIEADLTGVGKTLSTLLGAYGVAKLRGFTPQKPAKLLVVCPKSVIPSWQQTIAASGVNNLRIVVINYNRLRKLLSVPAAAANAKRTRTKNKQIASKGKSLVDWDIIISDESHKCKNQGVQRTNAMATLSRWKDKNPPFVIWASATIGQNPLELGYMAPLLGQLISPSKPLNLTPDTWGAWLERNDFAVTKAKVGYTWIRETPGCDVKVVRAAQQKDISRLSKVLFAPTAPSIRRHPEDIANWPKMQIISMPSALSVANYKLYDQLWNDFRSFLSLNPKGKNPKSSLAQQLRFRQKASLLRVDETFDFASDLLENGMQVAISVQFMETIDEMRKKFEKNGVACAEFSGRAGLDRTSERLRFQSGAAKVIFFTVAEGISLHALETLPDGSKAAPAKRATIIHDVRYDAISNTQISGRAHRDGQLSIVYLMHAKDTVEAKITEVMMRRMKNMKQLSGDSDDSLEEIEALLYTLAA